MPLFGKKKKDGNKESPTHAQPSRDATQTSNATHKQAGAVPGSADESPESQRPQYNFHCQLAHGSPTGIISGFTNVKELYAKIAECYNIEPSEIIFCTLNTHKIDMDRLLGGQIGLDDFLFAHVKGQKKEVEVIKSDDALGLTITDNGAGFAFIKRIKPDSVADQVEHILPGDHIEKIDGESFVGKRHFDVAKRLKEIPRGATFVLRLISPEKSPYANLQPRGGSRGHAAGAGGGLGSGKKTIRLKAKGAAVEEDAPDQAADVAIQAVNRLIEGLLGISDAELAQNIWELGREIDNPHDFALAVDRDLGEFAFPDGLVFDFWGAISDAKAGRLKSATPDDGGGTVEFTEEF
uniref:PDZ domain-containing protein n=1 Tax=Macrostomum lignano TaxID=282301 RepID=A0A1I8GC03_9PLAT